MVAGDFYHYSCYRPFPIYASVGRIYASKSLQVANIDDCGLPLFGRFSYFGYGEGLTLYHITDKVEHCFSKPRGHMVCPIMDNLDDT